MPIDELLGEPNGLAFFNADYIDPILHVAIGAQDVSSITIAVTSFIGGKLNGAGFWSGRPFSMQAGKR